VERLFEADVHVVAQVGPAARALPRGSAAEGAAEDGLEDVAEVGEIGPRLPPARPAGDATHPDIPAGPPPGKHLRKRGCGLPVLQGPGRGDPVAENKVETPTRLTARQKELRQELKETDTV
jgi:hypothetical protein